jgi:serine/threonine-protein kinase
MKNDAECVQRFLNEARRAAALRSERIARVHDVGQLDSGEPFLVMELLEGSDLGQHLEKHGPLAPAEAVAITQQICEGLAEAHALGVVHRDVKPANVFLARRADGQLGVKLLDFGISKQFTEPSLSSLTASDQSLGSPWYMSPEQMMDPSKVDQRSDIWSVGVVLFELLTAQRPFDGQNVPEVCAKVLTAPAPLLRELRADVDPDLEALVARCLEKQPNDRFDDVVELGTALQRFASEVSGLRPRVTPTDFFAAQVEELPQSQPLSLPVSQRATTPHFDSRTWFDAPPRDSDAGRDSDVPRDSTSGLFTTDPERYDSTAPLVGSERPATPTLRRRVRRAHVLGVVGVLGVLALLGFAVVRGSEDPSLLAGSRLKTAADKVPTVRARVQDLLPALAARTPLTPGPEPLPLEREQELVRPLFARTAPVQDSMPWADPEAAVSQLAAETGSFAEPSSSEAANMSTPGADQDAALSPDEVRARLERYEQWLREQGLTRLNQTDPQPGFMSEP